MTFEPPDPHSPEIETDGLQRALDVAMRSLADLHAQQSDRSCLLSVGGCIAIVGILAGIGLVATDPGTGLAVAFVVVVAIVLIGCVNTIDHRRASEEEVDELILAAGSLLSGAENLRLTDKDRSNLDQRLHVASPQVAVAILDILAVAGDAFSLQIARCLCGRTENVEGFKCGLHPEVRKTAAFAAEAIERRLELARQTSTLLRPSGSSDESELLRPSTAAGSDVPEQLLRPHGGTEE